MACVIGSYGPGGEHRALIPRGKKPRFPSWNGVAFSSRVSVTPPEKAPPRHSASQTAATLPRVSCRRFSCQIRTGAAMALLPCSTETSLRSLVRARLAAGRLSAPDTWLPKPYCGSGAACSLCDQPIHRWQVEYKVNHTAAGCGMSFHIACHEAYQMECACRTADWREHG